MTFDEWRDGLRTFLTDLADTARTGVPPATRYLPAWRWELEWWLVQVLVGPHELLDTYSELVGGLVREGRPVTQIDRFGVEMLENVLAYGLSRPVLDDQTLMQLAFSPAGVEWLSEKIGTLNDDADEMADIWLAAMKVCPIDHRAVEVERTPEQDAKRQVKMFRMFEANGADAEALTGFTQEQIRQLEALLRARECGTDDGATQDGHADR